MLQSNAGKNKHVVLLVYVYTYVPAQVLSLPDGKYTVPVSCPEPECRGRQFSPLRTSPQTLTVDWQTIRSSCTSEKSLPLPNYNI